MVPDDRSLPGPHDIVRVALPNGIVVLVRENMSARSVVITGALNAGSLYEPPEANGLAALVAALLLRGTEAHSFNAIHELLESNGASLSFSSGQHTVGFSGKGLAEDLPLLVQLLAEAVRTPLFPEDHVERVRGQVITGLKVQEQYTSYVAARIFRRLAYPLPHPYYYQTTGEIITVSGITRAQISAFHRQVYGPRGMIVVIVGAVRAEEAIGLVQRALGDWENPFQPAEARLPELAPVRAIRQHAEVMAGKSQVDLVWGVPGPSRLAPDWQAASLANNILGVFGMYGRIGKIVRERQGMAYYCYSRLEGGMGPGAWRVVAGVNPANVAATVHAIREEVRRLTTEPVSAAELADSQANFIGRLPLQLESNEGVAGVLMSMERYRLGLDYVLRYADEVRAVTPEAIRAAARRYLDPQAYVLAVAGPPVEGLTERGAQDAVRGDVVRGR